MNRIDAETQSIRGSEDQNQPCEQKQKSFGLCVSAALRFVLIAFSFAIASCSIPNLEMPQCTAARDAVKKFYSFHFGSDMSRSPGSLKSRKAFLTDNLVKNIAGSAETNIDYFTATDNYPKAFRVGECNSISDEKATLQVLLLWRDDAKSEQKEIQVETVLVGDKWLINKVSVAGR